MKNPFRFFLLAASIVSLACMATPSQALGQQKLIDLFFAKNVINREPVDPFFPGPHCETNGDSSRRIPVVDSDYFRRVYLWSHVDSSQNGFLRHSWYMNDRFMGATDLKVGISRPWRSWSFKSINFEGHEGKWKVVISTVGDPSKVLCVAHFRVE